MQVVARNAKRGAQFTPQGTLRFPLRATASEAVIAEIRSLIEGIAAQRQELTATGQPA